MAASQSNPIRRLPPARAVRIAVIALAAAALVLLLAAIPYSRVPDRGAMLFGELVGQIKGHPGATALICVCAAAGLWLGVGLLIATQEWFISRRSPPG